jgi:hypothetical protein
MATATSAAAQARFTSADQMREILDRVLARINDDDSAGPLLRATEMRLRLRCPDLDVAVNIAASGDPDSHIQWTFDERPEWEPRLELTMNSAVANAYLQGAASVPVAIARGEIRCSGDARYALRYLPAAMLISGPYRELLAAEHPELLVAG